ncbi:MAG: hypothetical protein ABSF09_10185 [Candidatus Bathyarchaeia archaeon]
MKRIMYLLSFLLILIALPTLQAQSGSGTGSFAFTLSGYTVQGQLANAIIYSDKRVSLTMSVHDNIRTSVGGVPISGVGEWSGIANAASLSGAIQDVKGTARVCIWFFVCGNANYIGQGTWLGSLSGFQGTGTFQGTITFTSSPVSQIPVNQPIPISGTWSSGFQPVG